MSLSQWKVGSFSIGRSLLILLVLFFTYTRGRNTSGIVGMAIGLSLALVDSSQFYLLGSFGLGGMLAGIFLYMPALLFFFSTSLPGLAFTFASKKGYERLMKKVEENRKS